MVYVAQDALYSYKCSVIMFSVVWLKEIANNKKRQQPSYTRYIVQGLKKKERLT